jgi:GNAT superfamily N-acetyltransferase
VLPTRVATLDDVPLLVALVNSAYRGESSRAGWTTEADLLGGQRIDEQGMAAKIAAHRAAAGSGESVVLLHERDGVPAACVHLERAGGVCHVGMLTIRPELQAHGLGRLLLTAAERWASEHWSSASARMHVIAQRTELIAWYERRGYRRTGARAPFPYGNPRFGLPRRDDLVFEVLEKTLDAPSL